MNDHVHEIFQPILDSALTTKEEKPKGLTEMSDEEFERKLEEFQEQLMENE